MPGIPVLPSGIMNKQVTSAQMNDAFFFGNSRRYSMIHSAEHFIAKICTTTSDKSTRLYWTQFVSHQHKPLHALYSARGGLSGLREGHKFITKNEE
jgi:hypothetical protein